jgi:erythromycin esterase
MPEARPFSPDDLTPLLDLVGDARVVAVGENNHHVREFGELRNALLARLITERGFTVLGFESGFAEGALVDRWVAGGTDDIETVGRDGFTFTLGESPQARDLLRLLREHGVRYAGLDVPASAGSPAPALRAVRAYLDDVDPAAVSLVDTAIAVTGPYAGVSSAVALGRYAALDAPARDAATAALTAVADRLAGLAPVHRERAGAEAHAVASPHARGALAVDTYLRELRELDPAAKVVVMLHNGHLQRIPSPLLPGTSVVPAGCHLATELGDGYFAVALTAGTGTTTGLAPDPDARLGFRLHTEQLGAPEPGSVEGLLEGNGPCLLDVRAARGTEGPTRIRHATRFAEVDVHAAFDALVYIPESHASL